MNRLFRVLFFLVWLLPGLASAATYNDSFPQADENPLSSSGTWVGGYTGFTAAQLKVVGHRVQSTVLGDDARMTVSGFSFGADQYVQVTLSTFNSADGIAFFLLLRWSAPTSPSGYEIAGIRSSGSDTLYIFELDGGENVLDSVGLTISPGDVFKATAVGSTITVYQNNVQILQTTDATYATGRVGLGAFISGTTGAGLADLEMDNFMGGDLGGTTSGQTWNGPVVFQ